MKKIISVVMILVMLSASLLTVSAENFVPSISYKPAPEIVTLGKDADGKIIIGYVKNASGATVTTEHEDCIVVTPVSEAETSDKIPVDAKETLLDVYKDLSDKDMKLSTLSSDLNLLVANALGDGKNADLLVVKDLFDVTVLCESMKTALAVDGNTIDLTFKVPVEAGDPVFVMTYKNGAWAPIEKAVNNEDGTITCTFEDFCPVAIFVKGEEDAESPDTGVLDTTVVWVSVAVVSAALIVAVILVSRRASKKSAK